jgi:hypothetical protein
MCDTCGVRVKLLTLKEQYIRGRRTGVFACPTCFDPDHPQNFLDMYVTMDPQALRWARPDTGLWPSRRLFPSNIWLRGQKPDVPTQEMLSTAQQLDSSNQKIETDWEFRRFWDSNQRMQQRFRGGRP